MANRTISSGHGKKVSGASYYIDEVTEARKVVNRVTEICEQLDPKGTIKYHEDSASNKTSNLNNIIKYHNSTNRSLDVSIHFNSAKFKDKSGEYKLECTDSAVGTETLYKTQAGKVWAAKITTAIASAGGFKDRGFYINYVVCKLQIILDYYKISIMFYINYVVCKFYFYIFS